MALALGMAQTASAVITTKEVRTPYIATVFDPCLGEFIDFSGFVHTLVTFTETPSVFLTKAQFNFSGVKGVSQTSGKTYGFAGSTNTFSLTSSRTGLSVTTLNINERLSHNMGIIRTRSIVTTTPDGDVRVSFSDATITCQGRTHGVTPSEAGACFNGIDDDLDGLGDCADSDCAGAVGGACFTGYLGACSTGTNQCVSGGLVCVPDFTPVAETGALCFDGIDNDCDGYVDAADGDCFVEP